MRLSVVIPTWNGWDLLKGTLAALQKAMAGLQETEVIVIDDGGDDDTAERIASDFPWVRLVCRRENGGFAAACNSGIAAAGGEWVLLLNNDMHPEADALRLLLESAAALPVDVFAVRPRIERGRILTDDEYGHMAMRLRLRRGLLRHELVRLREETGGREAFPVCSGGAGLFRRSMLIELEGFDEIYSPFYWEDVDLSYRALARGWHMRYLPEARFSHAEHGSIHRSFPPDHIQRISQRNAYSFHWMNLHDRLLLARHLLWLPLHLLHGVVQREWWRLQAFADALRLLPEIYRRRQQRCRQRQLNDSAILAATAWGHVQKVWQR